MLYHLRWDQPRAIAGACSLFILLNSISGLAGQLAKLGDASLYPAFSQNWPLALAVLAGGQIGSALGARSLGDLWLRRITAILVLYVAIRLLLRWLALN
jgi:uncharacterized membrane protein YfcA